MTSTAQQIDLKSYIRDVPDFPKPGILFKDIMPLVRDPQAFRASISRLRERYAAERIQKIAAIESRGFIFGAALAYEMSVGLATVRKVGKLPAKCVRETYDLEYGTDCVEMQEDAIVPDERVLVIDDVIATGGTLGAACRLVRLLGGEVVAAATIIELTFLPGREKLGDFKLDSLVQY